MGHSRISRAIAVILAVAMSAAPLVAQPNTGAVLNTSGGVTVNSTNVQRSAAVYHGDVIKTSDGYGEITLPGTTLSVSPNSQIVYLWKSIDLTAGSITVNTSTGSVTHACYYYVQPATAFVTGYQVTVSPTSVTVHSNRGALTINGLGKTLSVADGATETFPCDAAMMTAKNRTPPPAVHQAAARRIPMAVWIAAGAGAGAAAWGIAASSKGSVSPSQP